MTDSAQDYTYRVLAVDSDGLATIRVTSFDSLDMDWSLQLSSTDSDGNVSAFVDTIIDVALAQWAAERTPPTITLDTPVARRYKPRTVQTFPSYNVLTQTVDSADSETNDLITTVYTVRSMSDSEKAEVYSTLSVTRESMWQKLRVDGSIDTVMNGLGIRQPVHASWDATAAGSYNWSTDQISSLNVDSVSRVDTGRFKVHFTNPMADSNYSVFTSVGSTDYSGTGASPRNLSVIDRTPNYVEVLCERSDDAVNEDNFFNSVSVAAHKDTEEDSDFYALHNLRDFDFNHGLTQTIQSLLGKNDSDFADFLVN